eukprot:TRINITY_DN6283_c0_g1_i3.p1 TRINITY_DN6283_c0_g1~~TRINITY_DN6283_c0_g1_i3.p1  ORF type:complete len:240 (-),score=40.15 TRINITY_DN6283_c0_g1_i3:45-764(-)
MSGEAEEREDKEMEGVGVIDLLAKHSANRFTRKDKPIAWHSSQRSDSSSSSHSSFASTRSRSSTLVFESSARENVNPFVDVVLHTTVLERISRLLQLPRFLELKQAPEQNEVVGKRGEEIVFELLQVQYSDQPGVSVEWVNKSGETGLPYDIRIDFDASEEVQEAKSLYVEVKSTKSHHKSFFELSSQEWEFAMHRRVDGNYEIYRVYNVGLLDSIQIKRISNPAQLWLDGAIKICVAL